MPARVAVLHGCCKAPRTRSMVKGESLDAINDALTTESPVAFYYTCILTSTITAAGVPGMAFPKDCRWMPPAEQLTFAAAEHLADVAAFERELMAEAQTDLDLSPGVVGEELYGDGALRRILKAVAGPEVAWYVTVDGVRAPVLEYLRDENAKLSGSFVLVTHSLGSIIGYEAVAHEILTPVAFVTVGSPLAWKTIRDRLPSLPDSFPTWVNFFDPSDIANKRGPIRDVRGVENIEVDNPPVDGDHDLYGYLTHPQTRSKLEMLVNT